MSYYGHDEGLDDDGIKSLIRRSLRQAERDITSANSDARRAGRNRIKLVEAAAAGLDALREAGAGTEDGAGEGPAVFALWINDGEPVRFMITFGADMELIGHVDSLPESVQLPTSWRREGAWSFVMPLDVADVGRIIRHNLEEARASAMVIGGQEAPSSPVTTTSRARLEATGWTLEHAFKGRSSYSFAVKGTLAEAMRQGASALECFAGHDDAVVTDAVYISTDVGQRGEGGHEIKVKLSAPDGLLDEEVEG